VRRVVVVGNSGSGKTTLANAIAARTGAPRIELDSIFHQANWTPMEDEAFRAEVDARTAGETWVVDGNYARALAEVLWPKADTFVWLDYSRWVVTGRIVRRTIPRAFVGHELWNGNREHWRNLLSLDRQRSIIVWSVTQHGAYRARYLAEATGPRWSHGTVVRLRSPRHATAWLEQVSPT